MTEVLDRLEAGESPESIDAAFPDAGGEGDMGMGDWGGDALSSLGGSDDL